MGKTYEALIQAERERALQDPSGMARQMARVNEDRVAIWAELRACQEQVTTLLAKLEGVALDELVRGVARLSDWQSHQEREQSARLATEAAASRKEEELGRSLAELQKHSEALTGLVRRIEEAQSAETERISSLCSDLEETRRQEQQQRRSDSTERTNLLAKTASLAGQMVELGERLDGMEAARREGQEQWQAQFAAAQQKAAAAAEEVARRLTNLDSELPAALGPLRQQIAELRQGGSALQDSVTSLRTALADQEKSIGTRLDGMEAARRQTEAQWQEQLADAIGRAGAATEEVARRVASLDREVPAALGRLQEQVLEIQQERGSLQESIGSLRATVARQGASIGERIDGLEAVRREEQVRWQEQLAAALERAGGLTEEVARRVASLDTDVPSALDRLQQQVVELQQERGLLQESLDALRSGLARQEETAREQEAFREKVLPLLEGDGGQGGMATLLARTEAAVADTLRRLTSVEETQAAGLAVLRQQATSLRADTDLLRGGLADLRSLVEGQPNLAEALEELQRRMPPLVEVGERTEAWRDEMARAQAGAEEALRRVAASEAAHEAGLAELRQQLVGLQTAARLARQKGGSAPVGPAPDPAAIETLQKQLVALGERQSKLAEATARLEQGQAAAVEAARKGGQKESSEKGGFESLRQQMTSLRLDNEALRKEVAALQTATSRKAAGAGEVEALRAEIAPLAGLAAQQERLVALVQRAQATADRVDRRLERQDGEAPAGLRELEQQVSELVTDRAALDATMERRFELLCDIVEKMIEGQKQEFEEKIAALQGQGGPSAGDFMARLGRLEALVGDRTSPAAGGDEPDTTEKKASSGSIFRRSSARRGS